MGQRVTIVSGEWPRDFPEVQAGHSGNNVSPGSGDPNELIEADSPEGQKILVEAVRSLERRLSPEARTVICADQDAQCARNLKAKGFFLKLQSFYQLVYPKAFRSVRKEK